MFNTKDSVSDAIDLPVRPHGEDLSDIQRQLSAAVRSLPPDGYLILVVVAHPDDEAIGPGATLAMLSGHPHINIFLLVIAAGDTTRCSESARFAADLELPHTHVYLLSLPDGELNQHERQVRSILRVFERMLQPDVVFSHRNDNHPDHRTLFRAVREVFGRNGVNIFNFHIPQPYPCTFSPTAWIRVPEEAAQRKVTDLYEIYETENWKEYFDPIRALGLLRDAGLTAGGDYADPYEASPVRLALDRMCCGLRLARYSESLTGAESTLVLYAGGEKMRLVLELCRNGCGALAVARHSDRFHV